MPVSLDVFAKAYQDALENGNAALFAGAGLSVPAGFVNWRDLLADVVSELRLSPQIEDLIAVAQYHVNERGGRGRLNQLLIDEFVRDAVLTNNHRIIADLPIGTIWTTNYDRLLEDALRENRRRVDVKHRASQLAFSVRGRDVVLYKMHGDADHPDEAVLTKEDYETYHQYRRLFSYQLQGDLISKVFLFVGFSFTDPNIDYILARMRGLMGEGRREHYCLMKDIGPGKGLRGKKKAQHDYDRRRQELRISDLRRYGIQTVLLKGYDEVETILAKLRDSVYRRNLFISGSAAEFGAFGEQRIKDFCRQFGREAVQRNFRLTSGLGVNIGNWVVLGAMEAIYQTDGSRVDERLHLRPFPRSEPGGSSLSSLWERYRQEMISRAGVAVFISGNKLKEGDIVIADGCLAEFRLAEEQGRVPIPVGCTGYAAAQIWQDVFDRASYFFPGNVRRARKLLRVLNDADSTNENLQDAVFELASLAR